jgi:hypothetical protein
LDQGDDCPRGRRPPRRGALADARGSPGHQHDALRAPTMASTLSLALSFRKTF